MANILFFLKYGNRKTQNTTENNNIIKIILIMISIISKCNNPLKYTIVDKKKKTYIEVILKSHKSSLANSIYPRHLI